MSDARLATAGLLPFGTCCAGRGRIGDGLGVIVEAEIREDAAREHHGADNGCDPRAVVPPMIQMGVENTSMPQPASPIPPTSHTATMTASATTVATASRLAWRILAP